MANNKDNKALNAELSNALLTDSERLLFGFLKYWKPIVGVVVAILAVLLVYSAVTHFRAKSERAAAEALSAAETTEEIRAALVKHGNHASADGTRKRLAKQLIADGKYDEALKELAPMLADGELSARMLEGYLFELKKQPAEAAAKFAAIAGNPALDAFNRSEAKYAAGRLYIQLKDLKKAEAVLALETAAQSQAVQYWNSNAKQLLLELRNGDFGKLN